MTAVLSRRHTMATDTSHSAHKVIELIAELNLHVAALRENLIALGSSRDCPELREKVRRSRFDCVNACRQASNILLPQIRSEVERGELVDSQWLVLLFSCSQLLYRELVKSGRLVTAIPMDMSQYYGPGACHSTPGMGAVISQIIRHVPIAPSFQREEVLSIDSDCQCVRQLLQAMQEFLPQSDQGSHKTRPNSRRLEGWMSKDSSREEDVSKLVRQPSCLLQLLESHQRLLFLNPLVCSD